MDSSDLYTTRDGDLEFKADEKPIDFSIPSGEPRVEEKSELETKELQSETIPIDLTMDGGTETGSIEEIETPETEQLITGRSVGEEINNSPIDVSEDIIISDRENKIDFQQYALKNLKDGEDEQDAVTLKQLNNYIPEIEDDSITTDKIANGAITTAKIALNGVETDNIAAGAVSSNKLADNAVTAAKINNEAVTSEKVDVDSFNNWVDISSAVTIGSNYTVAEKRVLKNPLAKLCYVHINVETKNTNGGDIASGLPKALLSLNLNLSVIKPPSKLGNTAQCWVRNNGTIARAYTPESAGEGFYVTGIYPYQD